MKLITVHLAVNEIVCDVCQQVSFADLRITRGSPGETLTVERLKSDYGMPAFQLKDTLPLEEIRHAAQAAGWVRTGQTDPNHPGAILIGYMICPHCVPIVGAVRLAIMHATDVEDQPKV